MSTARFTELVENLPATVPFVGPDAHMRASGRAFRARLGANESGFGPSPKAIAAMQDEAAQAWMYGDSECHDLRMALAAHHQIAPENIHVGEGIDGILGNLVRLLVAPGDAVVTSDGAYPTFNYHVAGFGGALHKVPYRDDHEDPAALLVRAEQVGAKLLYFCNPDNPMGSWHSARIVQRLIDAVPEGTLLVLDEAYIDAAPEGTAPALDADDTRVIRMRTFSKLYGLAGMRIGYAIGAAPLIAMFDRIRNHFGVGRLAQAGALAALHDQAWLAHVKTNLDAARKMLGEIASDNGLHALPSATNFVTIDCGHDGAYARKLVQELMSRDVFVRMPFVAPHDRCIRVSAGPPTELAVFAEVLPQALRNI
ncbi:histidinol-phosphate aminotransferase [Roseinatronobacter thiooxidans]|uniref:histidinol-phosphate transaminase n=1 Tax=Roseinatronobacter thiooxidans TaxID=121821 RepID=A0A2W7QAD6_9RHOB|nr:pyridoxal phosphate-dependent aminotransferase [Roseinatronobacter thiooxidans]PZX38039.1 histidinol-phosphate aminotransferase [Roseinatronobacter thiooxidans]